MENKCRVDVVVFWPVNSYDDIEEVVLGVWFNCSKIVRSKKSLTLPTPGDRCVFRILVIVHYIYIRT